jgi:lipoprotein-releasing system permease protein
VPSLRTVTIALLVLGLAGAASYPFAGLHIALVISATAVTIAVALLIYMQFLGYEGWIGWRYLYGGKHDRMMLVFAGGSLGVALLGLLVLALGGPGNTPGVIAFVVGLISTAVFGLLSLFSVFTSVSVLGVALGVAALTIVLAVTTGFQKQFRDKVLGVNAHVIVLKSQATFAEYRDVM